MSLHVTMSIDRGATVLRLSGTADPAGVAARRAALAAAALGAPFVVIDLDGVTSAAPEGLYELVGALGSDLARVHLVARRNSVLATLALARVHHRVAVHRSIHDAFAAHRVATGGSEPRR